MNSNHNPFLLVLTLAAVVFVLAVTAGIGYEQFQRADENDRFPAVGRAFDIGGRSLNLFCSGAGGPAVIFSSGSSWPLYNPRQIFERGAPRPGYAWVAIQRETAKGARACWYDRAGAGWSDPGPYPRDSAAAARDLHALLAAAAIPAPYLLVADGTAALDARVYTGFYPAEVGGLVLVDPVLPGVIGGVPRRPRVRVPDFANHSESVVAQVISQIGLWRLAGNRTPPPPRPPQFTAAEWDTIQHLTNSPKAKAALIQETASWVQSSAEANDAPSLGDRPLLVLIPVVNLQAGLASLSTRGRQIVLDTADVPLPYYAPDAVIDAVRAVLIQIRRR